MKKINEKGFTLIELLVVIAIIGILSSVVLASLNSARQKSRDARRISDVKQLQLASELYYDTEGIYPPELIEDEIGDYIAAIPTDPQTGEDYPYAVNDPDEPDDYHIGADLEQSDHQVLDNDVDFDSAAAGWTGGFDGTDGTDPEYDMQP